MLPGQLGQGPGSYRCQEVSTRKKCYFRVRRRWLSPHLVGYRQLWEITLWLIASGLLAWLGSGLDTGEGKAGNWLRDRQLWIF